MASRGTMIPLVLTSVGIAGITGVSLHVLLTHGSASIVPPQIADWEVPLVAAAVVGAVAAAVMSRLAASGGDAHVVSCAACGASVHLGWRLCPECGYMLEGTA